MHIGLTYDLRDQYLAAGHSEEDTAEFDRPETIDAIEHTLQALGHQTDRIGQVRTLVGRLACGDRWDLVFNISAGLSGPGREAQIPAVLEAYDIPCTFSDASVMAVCLNKSMTKHVVRGASLPTPRSVVIRCSDDLDTQPAVEALRFPLFVKPIAEGSGKGISSTSRVSHRDELRSVCQQLLKRFHQPVLVEEFLPGRELAVGLLGTGPEARVLGTLEIVLSDEAEPDAVTYLNRERGAEMVEYRLVSAETDHEVRKAEEIALAAWQSLGCRDAGVIDLRSDAKGCPQFLEANPLAGLDPSRSGLPLLATALQMTYRQLIQQLINSAAKRCTAAHQKQCR
ncbi:MAG: D-alanine--D-alanine ligase [Fuerstiella sp.]